MKEKRDIRPMTVDEAVALAKKTSAWLETDDGKEAIIKHFEYGTPLSDRIYEARIIDTETLHRCVD